MALEKKFVKEAIRNRRIEEFLRNEFFRAGYSHSEIQRTPLSIRITIYAHKPGLIIGRGGEKIKEVTKDLEEKFGFENPQLEVQEVKNPDLDPFVISKWLASSIERGFNFKRSANIALKRVMDAGAVGVAIRISGKLGGSMTRVEKFSEGYLKYSGNPAETMVKTAYARAEVKLGTIGIQVRILAEKPPEMKFKEEIVKKPETEEKKKKDEEKEDTEKEEE